MSRADMYVWKFLLNKGEVVKGWEYYGARYIEGDTAKCKASMSKYGIDWEKTKPVQDDIEYSFLGTFTDEQHQTMVLTGTLITKDREQWKWAAANVSLIDLIEYMETYLPEPEILNGTEINSSVDKEQGGI